MSVLRPRLFLLWLVLSASAALATAQTRESAERARYIVHLSAPPTALFQGFPASSEPRKRALAPTHPKTVGKARLELSRTEVRAYRDFLAEERARFERDAEQRLGRGVKPVLSVDLVANALVLELAPEEAARLADLPGVERIEPDTVFTPQTDAGPAWVRAPELWTSGLGTATRGEGVLVGVIDTGLNASHPSFAGVAPLDGHVHRWTRGPLVSLCASPTSPPCNGKLVALRDFTGGSSSAEPDNGLDVDGHGSHVAGTAVGNTLRVPLSIGGQRIEREISGVAPRAHLASYKACELEADCLGSWLLAAINAAVADGVDIINYSIGGSPRDPWTDSAALALLAAREAGVVPVVAAGNEGPRLGTVTSPGNAPWVISVANTTHNRSIGSRLVDFSGGDSPAPGAGSLLGAGATAGYGPARVVIPEDFPGCGMGEGLGLGADNAPDGSSNPWAGNPNRFNGEIVVCLRGTQARLAKSDNVRRAGAGGMILLNTVGDGEGTAADAHSLPSTHLGYQAGEALLAWLQAGGERVRIEGAALVLDDALADRLASSSGRGPVDYGGVMLPSIAAPGTSIIAAAGTGSGVATLSGTSMASPHVAGAAALLRALRPDWSVDQVQSALMLTARQGLRAEDAVARARRIDIGAGGLDVAAAAQTALALEVTGSEFRAARPSVGGVPRSLNLPGLLHERCRTECALSRRLKDIAGGGRWRVAVELPGADASVSPVEFQIAAGATQRLDLQVRLGPNADIGRWLEGEVVLERLDAPGRLSLPVGVYADAGAVPVSLDLGAVGDAGFKPVAFSGLGELADLVVEAGAFAPVVAERTRLTATAAGSDAYPPSASSAFYRVFVLPAATAASPRSFRLSASLLAGAARTQAVHVGVDINGNGAPDESEELCANSGANPRCEVDIRQAGSAQRVWVMARNTSGATAAAADVELQAALLDPQPSGFPQVVASAPAKVPDSQAFAVRLAWNDATWQAAESRALLLSLRSAPGREPFARIPVRLRRDGSPAATRALLEGMPQVLRLAAGERRDGFYVDVPASATRLRLSAESDAPVRLEIARDPAPTQPAALRPAGLLPAVPATTGTAATLDLNATLLRAGRWWVSVGNSSASTVDARLSLSLESATGPVRPQFGAWYNPERSGSGLFLYGFGANWGFVWYTYLEDGTPTWYIGSAPAPEGARWRAPILRMAWNDRVARPVQVGQLAISVESGDRLQFGYELDGQFGSEPLRWIGSQNCEAAQPLAQTLNGLWYDVSNSGFGYSLDVSPEIEVVASFLYDARGWPRWVLGSGRPFGAGVMDLLQFSGTCPLCAYTSPQARAVGSLQVVYADGLPVRLDTAVDFQAPLVGSWVRSHPMKRLSSALGCPP